MRASACNTCGGELGDDASPSGSCKWCSADAEMASAAAQASSTPRQTYGNSDDELMNDHGDNSRAIWAVVKVGLFVALVSIRLCR